MSAATSAVVSRLQLEGECTIYRAAELKPLLLQAVQPGHVLEVDASGVTEIDSAGLQLLLLAGREARAQGGELRLCAASASVTEVLALLDLQGHFAGACS
jgi:anti-anti-sigma factor